MFDPLPSISPHLATFFCLGPIKLAKLRTLNGQEWGKSRTFCPWKGSLAIEPHSDSEAGFKEDTEKSERKG